jgi:hypothetical protein
MKHVQNLMRDLVQRRLWPVAVLLVVAAVALPLYLGRSSSSDGEGRVSLPAATAQVGAKASKAAVTLDDSSVDGADGGAVRNPFKQQHVAKAADAGPGNGPSSAAGGATSPAGGSGSGSSGGTSPAGGSGSGSSGGTAPSGSGGSGGSDTPGPTGSPGGTTPSGDAGAKDKPDPTISHVTLRLGPVGQLTTYKDVARLSALPSIATPLFAFTGVLDDGKTVVLLPASVIQVSPESDVQCKPSNASCQTLELTKEDTVFFTIAGDATAVRYQLDILSVQPRSGGSSKGTAAALARHSKAGAAMLRDAHVKGRSAFEGASAYRWLPDRGVLLRTPRHSEAHASANGAAAASAADVAATLPGLPVWHWHAAA